MSTKNIEMPIDYLRDIIVHETGLADARVNKFNQKYNHPDDEGCFITLAQRSFKPYGFTSEESFNVKQGMLNESVVNVQEKITIGIYSKDKSAFMMVIKVMMALSSYYAQVQQERNGFQISSIPREAQNLSDLEATALLNRFDMDVLVLSAYSNTQIIEYFETFDVHVRADDSTPSGIGADFKQKTVLPIL